MRATHVFRLFSMDTEREYVYRILLYKVKIRIFHTKRIQIISYSNLEKTPYFQGKNKNKFSYEIYRKIGKRRAQLANVFTYCLCFFCFCMVIMHTSNDKVPVRRCGSERRKRKHYSSRTPE